MDFIKQLFSDGGSVSMMRVMSIICCIASIILAIIGLNRTPIDYSGLSLLCGAFLSAAFGGKIMQKRIEADGSKTTTIDDIKEQ